MRRQCEPGGQAVAPRGAPFFNATSSSALNSAALKIGKAETASGSTPVPVL